jgi:hypothetical protein
MVAFICREKCLNDVTILEMKRRGYDIDNLQAYQIEEANAFLKAIYRINVESVNYRYDEETSIDCNFEYNKDDIQYLEQLVKSYHCWHYQSCEKDSEEFKTLCKTIEKYIESEFPNIEKRSDYETAGWDRA